MHRKVMKTIGKEILLEKSSVNKRIVILADMDVRSLAEGHSGRGGGQAASWLPQVATGFEQVEGFEFIWIMLDPAAKQADCTQFGSQWFIKIPAPKVSLSVITGHRYVTYRLNQLIRSLAPDLVHAWGLERAYPAVLAKAKVPTVLSVQGILSHCQEKGVLPETWQWRMQVRYEPKYIASADVVTCESKWGGNVLWSRYPGIDVRKVEYGVHDSFYKIDWNPSREDPYMIFVGTVSKGKGVDILLDALESLPGRKWRCLVVGSGPLVGEIKKRQIEGVELLGMVPWDVLQEKMRMAWVLVLPTLADTSANVVKEARVLGMPVIASMNGGHTDYLIHEGSGLLVDPLDVPSLAFACDRMMSDYETVRRMGATNHKEDRDYFQPENTCNGFLEIYRELLSV